MQLAVWLVSTFNKMTFSSLMRWIFYVIHCCTIRRGTVEYTTVHYPKMVSVAGKTFFHSVPHIFFHSFLTTSHRWWREWLLLYTNSLIAWHSSCSAVAQIILCNISFYNHSHFSFRCNALIIFHGDFALVYGVQLPCHVIAPLKCSGCCWVFVF